MKLKLTLQRPSGPETDIVVTTDAAASVGEVAAAIAAVDPFSGRAMDGVRTLRVKDAGGDQILEPALAVGEAPVGSGARVEVVSPSAREVTRAQDVATLRIIDGPDRGTLLQLPVGTKYLGRDAAVADLVLNDPLVSKRHARVDVFSQTIRVVDLNSANGVEVDGALVSRIDLQDGAEVRLGDTVLRAELRAGADETSGPIGPVAFNRSPRVEPRYKGDDFKAPTMPTEKDVQPFPWLASLLPVVLGLVFFFTGRPIESLIFIAASPLLMVGSWLTTRATRRRKEKLDIERFTERLDLLEATLAEERTREREVRLRESPSTAEVLAAADELGSLLWTRRPEHWQFLSLNLGLGTMDSRSTVAMSNEEAALPQYLDLVQQLSERYRLIDGVPVAENLYFAGAIGVAGQQSAAADLARSVVVQLAGTHSPSELVVAAIVNNSWTVEFEWLKWLPHTGSPHSPLEVAHLANTPPTGESLVSALEELIAARSKSTEERGAILAEKSALVAGAAAGEGRDSASPPPASVPAVLVIISEDAPVDRARLVQLSERAADAGVYPLWVASSVAGLPAVARTFVSADPEGTTAKVGLVRLGGDLVDVASEPVDRDRALSFARRLAPVSDAGALLRDASDLPRMVSMLSLIGPELATSTTSAVERWKQNDSVHDRSGAPMKKRRAGRLRALVGQSGVDAMHLDLRTQGPHALVGGTTGAGKSEFLQAWVLGMAAEYSPDRVTFLFVDYKGGSAFAECVNLPHCVGLVTDLSPHLVRRALTSLRAELHYREHLLNRKKAKDLLDLEKSGDPESPPALVLVIDEFAALAKEVPEFVDGVVDIAQRGRSLGIHLIMATQRPAGVIKDNLRANTPLRIALRMADESDSLDVVGDKVAATFDPSLPGRGIAKTGPGRLVSFQSAYAGGWTTDEPVEPSVDVAELRFGAEQAWEAPGAKVDVVEGDNGPTDQARLVANLVAAAKSISLPAPRRPWLDELAPVFDLTKLRQRTDSELVFGVCDMPELQQQQPVRFRPDVEANIIIFGAGGSGKSVTLRTLASAAGITPRGGPVDVYGIDFGSGALKMLEVLPHVGSIVSGDDPERVVRLMRLLRGILDDRRGRYTEVNADNIERYRSLAEAPDERRILLLVDNFPAFRNEFEVGASRAPWYQVFLSLLQEGRAFGVHVAMTADRPGSVPNSVAAAFQQRVVHRMSDESSYALLDVPMDVLGANSAPGRALVDGFETQVAIVGGNPNAVEQSRAIAELGKAMERAGRPPAEAIGSLPSEIDRSSLPPQIDGKPVLGVSDDTLEPVTFEPTGAMLLAGPPASGRTTALASLIAAVDSAVPGVKRYYLGNARSAVGSSAGWANAATTIEDVSALAKELSGLVADPKITSKIFVVVEQIADFLSTPADAPIVELIKAVKRSDHFLLAEGETSQWSSSWPILAEVKAVRTGFLLQPEGMEGDTLLRTALPRVTRGDFPAGRGYFISRGRATRVQLPLVEME